MFIVGEFPCGCRSIPVGSPPVPVFITAGFNSVSTTRSLNPGLCTRQELKVLHLDWSRVPLRNK